MAVSKLQRWCGSHFVGTDLMLYTNYDVYVDMANASATPYLRLNGCSLYTAEERYNQVNLSAQIPATLRVQVGSGTTYAFTIDGTVNHHAGTVLDLDTNLWFDEYYNVDFSSSTDVYIPKDGTEFVLNLTLILKNGSTYTMTEHAAGPMANSISGSTSINTGAIVTYRLGRSVVTETKISTARDSNKHALFANMCVQFSTKEGGEYFGYPDGITSASDTIGTISQLQYAIPRRNVAVGTVARANQGSYGENNFPYNAIVVEYRYYSNDMRSNNGSLLNIPDNFSACAEYIVLSRMIFGVTITARSAVDSSLRPTLDIVSYNAETGKMRYIDSKNRYGAGIQGQTTYDLRVYYYVKCGNIFRRLDVLDYRSSSWRNMYDYGNMNVSGDGMSRIGVTSGSWLLDTVITNAPVRLKMVDMFGLTTEYTDYITVKSYRLPVFTTHTARRCSAVSPGVGPGYYTYDGQTYCLDDNGDHVLIEWGISITPIDNINSRGLKILIPKPAGQSGTSEITISLTAYSESGFLVTYADPEQSYDIVFTLSDDFTRNNNAIRYTVPLSTAVSAIDFLNGGFGLAFGKIAELDHIVDFNRTWTLHMPYDTKIQDYNAGGSAARLYDWIQTTSNRVQAVTNSRDVAICGFNRVQIPRNYMLYGNNTVSCIPSGYGEIRNGSITGHGSSSYTAVTTSQNVTIGMLFGGDITISRRYIRITVSHVTSFVANTERGVATKPLPTIYIMGTKPTTINQSTGVPNGTILTQHQIPVDIDHFSQGGGYQSIYYYPGDQYIDVSSFQGRDAWIVLTVAEGNAIEDGRDYFTQAYVSTGLVLQTNNRS